VVGQGAAQVRSSEAPAATRELRNVAVLYHPQVEESQDLAREIAAALAEVGVAVTLHDAWTWPGEQDGDPDVDWVVTLGGDGTVLRAARKMAAHNVPVTGVNFGRLGFLAEIEPAESIERVVSIAKGEGHVEHRLMLSCSARVSDGVYGPVDAVNDIFVGRGRVARAVRLEVSVDDIPVVRFVADGILVATPTGSTAYSLSAGGPIVFPEMDALIVTPVVPHPTPVRPLVLPPESTVDIWLGRGRDAILTVDGQEHQDLDEGDHVRVRASEHRALFLRKDGSSRFLRTLVDRLRR